TGAGTVGGEVARMVHRRPGNRSRWARVGSLIAGRVGSHRNRWWCGSLRWEGEGAHPAQPDPLKNVCARETIHKRGMTELTIGATPIAQYEEQSKHGLASPRDLPRRGPGAVLPRGYQRAGPTADRRGEVRLPTPPRGQRVPHVGARERPGRGRLGRHERRRAASPEAPQCAHSRAHRLTDLYPTGGGETAAQFTSAPF